ncbi:MAG TPA: amidohydrolase family protein [Cryptosporangiaceae bacterium]|nr:amidohydrolase family protein [Cryptosporangiaceae bacterium]
MSTLYRNGHVYSAASPHASALLVDGDRIRFVGSEDAADGCLADEVVDLGGALVTPAFVDAHVHTTAAGLALDGLDLARCTDRTHLLGAVERQVAIRPGPVIGHGWDDTSWTDRRLPTAIELDRASGGVSVYLSRVDKHSALVSSALMAAVEDLADLAGFDPDGRLTREAHHAVRDRAFAALTPTQRTAAQRATRAAAAAAGIGALHECGGPTISSEDDFTGLLALAVAEPGPEVYGYWAELNAAAKARDLGAVGAGGDLFADGALGSHTASLRASYADRETSGQSYLDGHQVAEHLVDCVRNGVQGGFHAIGDRALHTVVLEGFAAAAGVVGVEALRAGRHRVEHAEMADAALIRGMVEYGVVASVQPAFDAAWGGAAGMYAQRLGVDRALTLNPFAAMANVGVPLAFGSDAPVTPLDPWGTVKAATSHRNPRHALPVRAAFAAHTRGGWRAMGRDDEGMLAVGAPATFAVWATEELVASGPVADRLPDLGDGAPRPTCLRTVVRGLTVHALEGVR